MREPGFFEEQSDPETIDLYEWQENAVEAMRENIRRGVRNQILAAPTGSGKTVVASYLIRESFEKGKRAIFVADRVNLIDQTSAVFDRYGIPHGVIQGNHWRWRPHEQIQIATPQTRQRRSRWPDADLIIVDEAHSMYKTTTDRISKRDTITIGLTATPFTRGLGKIYDAVVTVRTTNQLISDGYLAPYRIFAASEPDMTGVKVNRGEWAEGETAKRAMPIIGDIVTEYLRHGEGKKFIAFGVNVAHCEELQRQFLEAGIVCGLYTYRTSDEERAGMIEDFQEPDSHLRGLISVAALAKGFDNPSVEVVIMARPLRASLAEHIQILGRGLRRDPDNPEKECIVLDHAGNCVRFWDQMNDFFEYGVTELDMGRPKDRKKKERKKKEREPMKCRECAHVHDPAPMCPMCGYEYPKRSNVEHVAGELNELTGLPAGSEDDRQAVYSGLLYIAIERGYQEGWAAHQYRSRYKAWPNGLRKEPAPPTPELRRWVRSRLIAFLKARGGNAA